MKRIVGTDNTCKIIYLGDHCQMAPVFEKISPIYETPKGFTLLTQAMRNAGQPALMNLCTQLRHTVETLEFYAIEEVPGVIDYVSGDDAYQCIIDIFKVEDPSARILWPVLRPPEQPSWCRVHEGCAGLALRSDDQALGPYPRCPVPDDQG